MASSKRNRRAWKAIIRAEMDQAKATMNLSALALKANELFDEYPRDVGEIRAFIGTELETAEAEIAADRANAQRQFRLIDKLRKAVRPYMEDHPEMTLAEALRARAVVEGR